MTATIDQVRVLIDNALGTGGRALRLDRDSRLLGSIPELDSMAIAALITALSDHFDIVIDDGELDAELFATLGTLTDFVEQKRGGETPAMSPQRDSHGG
ncbi:acyl carrier protein [Ectothiorhodospira sp. BSL-9]|uniref:acyl carrier protein n=1 Tax=Ectothiorhodospira sp. BSL-9 TaxID=1442136 RepID=UPI0007B4271C|nr:acyl carrier protein [Ectothiorhodospira sp. BSL-9]ANB02208.1 hypothetical protein ECTOBSL9_1545 [Ectothiorhodospira sp. BSL-9]